MKTLQQRIEHILKTGIEFRNKYFSEEPTEIEFVTLFTKSDSEYEELIKEINNIGEIKVELPEGVFVNLHNPLSIGVVELKNLQVTKPRENSPKVGSVTFIAKKFKEFKERFNLKAQDDKLIKELAHGDLELVHEDYDVIIFITPKHFEEIHKRSSAKDQEPIKDEADQLSEIRHMIEHERHQRMQLMADFQNYQKRVEQEKANWGAISNLGLIQELLEVYDDLQLAISDENLNLDHAKTSIVSAQDKLIGAALRSGIEKVEVKVGDEFDKEKMEAVSAVAAGEESKGKIVAVISSAYKYVNRDGILKPAKVVVGK